MKTVSQRKSSRSTATERARVLKAATTVYLRDGFERASVDRIAATARMSKQSIYGLFPGREALFEATVRELLDNVRRNMTLIEDMGDVPSTLQTFGLCLFDAFSDPVGLGLFRANVAAANHFPALAAEVHEQRLEASRPLADYVQKHLIANEISDGDALMLAVRFGGLAVEGSRYFLGQPVPDTAQREVIVKRAVDLFLKGYGAGAQTGMAPPEAESIEPPALAGGVALRMSSEKFTALVDAAAEELIEHGYRGAGVDRIAASVRASKATVYRQFGNKENLFRYIVQRDIFETSRSPIVALPRHTDVVSALAALARHALDLHLAPDNIGMHRLLIQEADCLPELARQFHDVRVNRLGKALCTLLDAHARPVPDEVAQRAFYSLATFTVRFVTTHQLPDAAQRDVYSQECARLFLAGIHAFKQ